MTRLALSGIFEKYPDLKIITHHCGGMIPFFADRIVSTYNYCKAVTKEQYLNNIKKPPIEYFKKFYADTALNGGTSALMCGLAFFGIEKILFASDMPFDDKLGKTSMNDTIEAIEAMDISRSQKGMIFEENAVRLLRLNIHL
jgi:aminocarboxymuconate-semialdehyde decarboxylase